MFQHSGNSDLCSALLSSNETVLHNISPTHSHAIPRDDVITDNLHFEPPNLWSPFSTHSLTPIVFQNLCLLPLSYSNIIIPHLQFLSLVSTPYPSVFLLSVTLFMFSSSNTLLGSMALHYNHHIVFPILLSHSPGNIPILAKSNCLLILHLHFSY